MATIIGPFDGIKYGFKLLLYYLAIAVIGGVVTAFGFGIASAELALATDSFRDPNIPVLLAGSAVSMVGISILYAGTLGIGYKVIADAVYTGNIEAEEYGTSPSESSQPAPNAGSAAEGDD